MNASLIPGMLVCEAPQGSDDWKRARAGVTTASVFKTARSKLTRTSGAKRAGDPTDASDKLAFRLAIERINGAPLDDGFEGWAARRGHELEPAAREAHSFAIGAVIHTCGVVLTPDRQFGCSADGLIGLDGGAEYKCLVSPDTLMPVLLEGDFSEYEDQIQGCMWLTGRSWWDFCLYCPALRAAGRELTRYRVPRSDDYIESLEADLIAFNRRVAAYETQLRKRAH